MSPLRNLLILFLVLFLSTLPGVGQSRSSRKPVIIRDTGIAEGIETEERKKIEELNPKTAKKNIDIGDFYYKKKNYAAAIGRYLPVVEYQQPYSDKAYKALVKAQEKLIRSYKPPPRTLESFSRPGESPDQISSAIQAFNDFLSDFPESTKGDDFRKMIAELEEKKSRSSN